MWSSPTLGAIQAGDARSQLWPRYRADPKQARKATKKPLGVAEGPKFLTLKPRGTGGIAHFKTSQSALPALESGERASRPKAQPERSK